MRVVLVTQYFPPERGAAQVRLGAIVDHLHRRGYDVEVLTTFPNYPLGRTFDEYRGRWHSRAVENGVVVRRVRSYASLGAGTGRAANFLSFLVAVSLGLIVTRRADLVLIESPPPLPALPAMVAARVWRAKSVVIAADLWAEALADLLGPRSAMARIAKRVEEAVLRRADAVTAVTEGVKDAVVAYGVDPGRVVWLPNGVDPDVFSPAADGGHRPAGGDASTPVVVYAGTMGYVHGLDVVLDAAERIDATMVTFLLVGGGSERRRLEGEAARRGLDHVRFHDPVAPERVAELLRGAAVGLATVRGGDAYRAVRSAKVFPVMASGVPVVYSGDDEGSRLVAAVGAGIVVPPGDGAALAEAIERLVGDPATAARMGAAGRAWVVANASWTAIVDRWLDELSGLGAVEPPGSPR